MKILIIGHGGCGKGEVADRICKLTGLKNAGSVSEFMSEYMAKILKTTPEKAYANRRNHRELWAEKIDEFRAGDPGKILRTMAELGDVINGGRRREEFDPVRHLFDCVVWVARSVPIDPTMQLHVDDADVVLDNNGTLEDLDLMIANFVDSLDHPKDHL